MALLEMAWTPLTGVMGGDTITAEPLDRARYTVGSPGETQVYMKNILENTGGAVALYTCSISGATIFTDHTWGTAGGGQWQANNTEAAVQGSIAGDTITIWKENAAGDVLDAVCDYPFEYK